MAQYDFEFKKKVANYDIILTIAHFMFYGQSVYGTKESKFFISFNYRLYHWDLISS